jgi:MFS family permease
MPLVVMVAVLSAAGFMRGTVQATRDLIVLSITPKGSTGKVFAFVYNGTMIGAAIMPLVFGWVMDRGQPGGVFWITAVFMMVSLLTFFGVKRLAHAHPRVR